MLLQLSTGAEVLWTRGAGMAGRDRGCGYYKRLNSDLSVKNLGSDSALLTSALWSVSLSVLVLPGRHFLRKYKRTIPVGEPAKMLSAVQPPVFYFLLIISFDFGLINSTVSICLCIIYFS